MSHQPYIIASHGCSKSVKSVRSFFKVPNDITIVYFNNHGVLSNGDKNIPFIKNLYDYEIDLLRYIVAHQNYKLNLDKTNPQSYRHPDFFKSLPVYSTFNYLCNMELYPPGSDCPKLLLTFDENPMTYFQGITKLESITFNEFAKFLDVKENYDPRPDILPHNKFGQINIDNLFNLLKVKKNISSGIFFVSACRVDVYKKGEEYKMINIEPTERNCQDVNYDYNKIDELISNPDNLLNLRSLQTTKERFTFYNDKRLEHESKFLEPRNANDYYAYSLSNRLYNYLFNAENLQQQSVINICVNFTKLNVTSTYAGRPTLPKIINDRISYILPLLLGEKLHRRLKENADHTYYVKFKYFIYIIEKFICNYARIPSVDEFKYIFNLIFYYLDPSYIPPNPLNESFLNHTKELLSNRFFDKKYLFKNEKDYKYLYQKYKSKYLKLKNIELKSK